MNSPHPQLPHGWAWATVADTGAYINGLAFSENDWVDGGLPIIRIQNLTDPTKPLNRTRRSVDAIYKVQPGDILVSWSATLDAFIWHGEPALLNQHIFRVMPATGLTKTKFLYYLLRQSIATMRKSTHLHGSTMKHINRGPFLEHVVPIPPLHEQVRIADALDEQFTRLDAAVSSLQRARTNLNRYRAAVLNAAVEARLFPADGQWGTTTLAEVATLIDYGTSAKTGETPGVPVLRMGNLVDGKLATGRLKYLSADHSQFPGLLLSSGDLLFNRTNSAELVGKTAVYHGNPAPCSFASYLIRVRLGPRCDPDYLSYFLNSAHGRTWVKRVAVQQVGQANVNGSKLKTLRFPLPSMAEQRRIVADVERRLSSNEDMEATVDANLKRVKALRQAILMRAFEGRLVSQEPTDEPATVLLERIRGERAAPNRTLRQPRRATTHLKSARSPQQAPLPI